MTELKASVAKVLWSKAGGDFAIVSFTPDPSDKGLVELNETWGTFTVKGNFPTGLKEGTVYKLNIEPEESEKYGLSYSLVYGRQDIDLNNEAGVKAFLESIISKARVKALFDALGNPLEAIKNENVDLLKSVKGIGESTANKIIEKYSALSDNEFAHIELSKYGLSLKTIEKICRQYKSPELAVQKIRENPYQLTKLDGIGFKKCDEIFLKMGGDINAPVRIRAFLVHALYENANSGHTWLTPQQLMDEVYKNLPNVNTKLIGEMLKEDSTFLLSKDNKISLTELIKLESNVALELIRLLNAENAFEYNGWEEEVAKTEERQGWQYTSQQKEAMKMILENNVSILEGVAGSGKTASLKAVLDILESAGYLYASCALSGKAANNITLVTGKEGSTIHRLLGFSPEENGFKYNAKNKLPHDIIVVDEQGMVDAKLFLDLLVAIRDGGKLIMLGDSEQLPALTIPTMRPMINSEVIPRTMLTQIHRQAEKSAIVTHSIAIRNGKNLMQSDLGRYAHGELLDLEYENVTDEASIPLHAVTEFSKYIKTHDVMDVQILSAMRTKGNCSCYSLNKSCQKIYNPASPAKEEIQVVAKGFEYVLREGDKVINIQNNYHATDENGRKIPVFNGNMGILERIDEDEDGVYMLINFEGIGKIKILEEKARTIELAYAITTHKSQGASIPIVIVAFPFNYMLNSRQYIYTAITRASEKCIVLTSKDIMRKAISKNEAMDKQTYLSALLKAQSKIVAK